MLCWTMLPRNPATAPTTIRLVERLTPNDGPHHSRGADACATVDPTAASWATTICSARPYAHTSASSASVPATALALPTSSRHVGPISGPNSGAAPVVSGTRYTPVAEVVDEAAVSGLVVLMRAGAPGSRGDTSRATQARSLRRISGSGRGGAGRLVRELGQQPASAGNDPRRRRQGEQVVALAAVLVGLVEHGEQRLHGLGEAGRDPERQDDGRFA